MHFSNHFASSKALLLLFVTLRHRTGNWKWRNGKWGLGNGEKGVERSCKQQNWNANGSVELSCLLMSGGFISAHFRTKDLETRWYRGGVWEPGLSHVWQTASGAAALADPVIASK